MSDKLQSQLEKHLETVPVKFQMLARKALTGKLHKAMSVKAKCQECVGYEEVVRRVGGCTVWRCPLWHVRPYQKGDADLTQDATPTSPGPQGVTP